MEAGESSSDQNKTVPAQQQQPAQIPRFTKKNWDAIIDEFEKEEEKEQNVNDLFKQIYQSGDDEVRKAMNKSFQESGGTVLSTNWANVAQCSPFQMEAVVDF